MEEPEQLAIARQGDGVRFEVHVAPRAGRSAVLGVHGGRLKVALAAPPVEGAANAELVAFLARALGRPKRDVALVHGARSRRKTVVVAGVTAEEVLALLG